MKKQFFIILIATLINSVQAEPVEDILADFRNKVKYAVGKLDATLQREGTTIAAKLVSQGDSESAAIVADQIKIKIEGGSVVKPYSALSHLFIQYDAARAATLKPFQISTLQRLDDLLKTPAGKNMEAVLSIGAARKQIETGRYEQPKPSDESTESDAPISDSDSKIVEIDAASEGYSIGHLKAGQRIRLSYVEGTWTAYVTWPAESPDQATIPQHKLSVAWVNQKGKSATEVPPETKKRPFTYKVKDDGEYSLKIMDSQLQSNVGKVRYRISILSSN